MEAYVVHIYLELCDATVDDYFMNKYKGRVPPDDEALHQMANGFKYIQDKKFVHRGIKPNNILISSSDTTSAARKFQIFDSASQPIQTVPSPWAVVGAKSIK